MSLAVELVVGTAWLYKAYGVWEKQSCNFPFVTVKVLILRNSMT